MQYSLLPNTQLNVSKICLGTMTYGEQNTEEEAHQQLDYATEQGVNFIDAAEMYPIPRSSTTQGLTEQYIGSWLKKKNNRGKIIIATKITGPDAGLEHIRKPLNFSRMQINEAVNGNLKRLQTDYIDLYQLHWPERNSNRFGIRYYPLNGKEQPETDFLEILQSLSDLVKAGKIRHIGVSNETPRGLMKYLQLAEKHKLPRMISIQNCYNLLNCTFEYGLSEICMKEKTGLLAYSPMGFGMLSGKYHKKQNIEKARLTLFPQFKRYNSKNTWEATGAFLAIAEKHSLSLPQMALAYVNTRPFVTSTIIGASTMDQLKENIGSIDLILKDEVMKEIENVIAAYPDPAP